MQWWQLQQDVDWLKERTVTLQTAQENFHHSLGQVVETAVQKEVSQKFPQLTNVRFPIFLIKSFQDLPVRQWATVKTPKTRKV